MADEELKYVAFLDILGFKEIVNRNDHGALLKKFNYVFQVTLESALSIGKYLEISTDKGDRVVADLSKSQINCLSISDSVILWTDNASMKAFLDLAAVVFHFMQGSLAAGFPLRGSISVGNLSVIRQELGVQKTISRQTLLGKALVTAYALENQQEWVGCVIDNQAFEHFVGSETRHSAATDLVTLDYLIGQKFILRYPVPTKGGEVEGFVINWALSTSLPLTEEWLRKVFSMHEKNIEAPGVQQKLLNTLRFFDHLQTLSS